MLALGVMLSTELAFRLPWPQQAQRLLRLAGRTPRIWGYARGLEDRKARATQAHSAHLLGTSLGLLALIGMLMVPVALALSLLTLMHMAADPLRKLERLALPLALVSLVYGCLRLAARRYL